MGMNPDREAEAMKDLGNKKPGEYRRVGKPSDAVNWVEWEKTHDFPTHDGDSGLQFHEQKRCEMADNFSANFRRLMDANDFTLHEIGEEVRLSPETLRSYLINKRVPRLHSITAISNFFTMQPWTMCGPSLTVNVLADMVGD